MSAGNAIMHPRNDSRRAWMRDVGNALTHSLELVIAMVIGIGLGWKVQQHWPSLAPWGLIGGSVLGAGAVMRSMWRMISESGEADSEKKNRERRDD